MNKPYGGDELTINLPESEEEQKILTEKAEKIRSLHVPKRFLSDCEMLSMGAFSPLEGFMNKEEIDSVLDNMELTNGLIWGIPIILLASEEEISTVKIGEEVVLRDGENRPIALMKIEDKFKYPKDRFCKEAFKTTDDDHPGVKAIKTSPDIFLTGPVKLINRPLRENIDSKYYLDPSLTRKEFQKRGWETIVAFQTRNPIHRAHEYLIKCSLEPLDGVLIHPLVGETKSDDIPADVRMDCYEVLIKNYFNPEKVVLSVLPTYMRYGGPREALNHAIMRKNYGSTHFIIGRDHAGVGDYYGTYEAQELLSEYAERIGITPIEFEHAFFCKKCNDMGSSKTCPHSAKDHLFLSGTKVRAMLKEGVRPPLEFSRKEVVDVLIEWAIK